MRGFSCSEAVRTVFILIVCLMYALPFAVLTGLSLSDPASRSAETFFPSQPRFSNFSEAAKASRMGRAALNSALITLGAVSLLVVSAGMAAYVIARFPKPPVRLFFTLLLGSMMIPGIINPFALTMLVRLRGINTRWAMIAVCAVNALPFAVFLYTGFIRSIPLAIEDSAVIDGCSSFSVFLRIVFPMLMPVTASVLILNGIGIWNNYGQAVFFLQARDMKTVPLAYAVFFSAVRGALESRRRGRGHRPSACGRGLSALSEPFR
jgi:raffinose/stachyose/melibiose transport system permease protein